MTEAAKPRNADGYVGGGGGGESGATPARTAETCRQVKEQMHVPRGVRGCIFMYSAFPLIGLNMERAMKNTPRPYLNYTFKYK